MHVRVLVCVRAHGERAGKICRLTCNTIILAVIPAASCRRRLLALLLPASWLCLTGLCRVKFVPVPWLANVGVVKVPLLNDVASRLTERRLVTLLGLPWRCARHHHRHRRRTATSRWSVAAVFARQFGRWVRSRPRLYATVVHLDRFHCNARRGSIGRSWWRRGRGKAQCRCAQIAIRGWGCSRKHKLEMGVEV